MKLWELRSYEQAVGMEQDRLIYQARLQARYGRAWRRKAPVEALMPLRLARIGVPLSQTAPEGLAAAGIDPVLLPPAAARGPVVAAGPAVAGLEAHAAAALPAAPGAAEGVPAAVPAQAAPAPAALAATAVTGSDGSDGSGGDAAPEVPEQRDGQGRAPQPPKPRQPVAPAPFAVDPTAMPAPHDSAWFAGPLAPQAAYEGAYAPHVEGAGPAPAAPEEGSLPEQLELERPEAEQEPDDAEEEKFTEAAYEVFRAYIDRYSHFPEPDELDKRLSAHLGQTHPRSEAELKKLMPALKQRYQRDLESEHIA